MTNQPVPAVAACGLSPRPDHVRRVRPRSVGGRIARAGRLDFRLPEGQQLMRAVTLRCRPQPSQHSGRCDIGSSRLTFALSMLLYVDRVAISTARGPITSELGLSDTQFGWVLSAFALGYALFQTPGGLLADRYGARLALTSVVSAVVGVHRPHRPGARVRDAAAVPLPVRRRRSRGVSDLREGLLQLAAGRRTRARPGHQFFGRAARRRVRAAGGRAGLVGAAGWRLSLLPAGRRRVRIRGTLVVVVP